MELRAEFSEAEMRDDGCNRVGMMRMLMENSEDC